MFIFYLAPRRTITVPAYDTMKATVVIAADEKKARKLAAGVCGDEGPEIWLDPNSSLHLELAPVAHPFNAPQVLCRDFRAG